MDKIKRIRKLTSLLRIGPKWLTDEVADKIMKDLGCR